MAAATDQQIREALAANLSNAYGDGVQVSAWLIQPTPPAVMVGSGPIQFDQSMGSGLHNYSYVIHALVPLTLMEGSQISLSSFRDVTGSHSVKAALEANRTLSGIIHDLHVSGASEETIVDGKYAGCQFNVLVLNKS